MALIISFQDLEEIAAAEQLLKSTEDQEPPEGMVSVHLI